MEEIVYNPISDRVPSGTLKTNQFVLFNLKIRCDLIVNKVILVLRYEKNNDTKFLECELVDYDINYFVYGVKTSLGASGLYWYHFEVETNKGKFYVNKSDRYESSLNEQEEFPLTVVKNEIKTNKKFRGGIIYHIFVDRFNRVGKVNVRDGFVFRDDWGGKINKNTDYLTEQVRQALSRSICKQNLSDAGELLVITLAPEIENTIAQGVAPDGVSLALEPDFTRKMLDSLNRELEKSISGFGAQPVILCSSPIRLPFRRLIERTYPQISIMSYNEISNNTKAKSVGVVRLDVAMKV